ncbi:hypothetical protein [Plebeiibacterium marinum]|uniref:Uncharacterized protein n=1 Tax=Plebeiibacterium marinum TaxID=2992111 RepID=A0AAE3SL77_9BACT|nr:hypothetical protein [Plebeiobacterium marinum]MCW3806275.1 hypothetical protein [Plebeiobacterium marinum]
MRKDYKKFSEFIDSVTFTFDPEMDVGEIERKIKSQIPEHTLPNQFYYITNNYTREIIYVSESITEY